MKRLTLSSIALALALGSAAPALANGNTYFGFQIGISNAPPPPRVVYAAPPVMTYVPEAGVYVVQDGYDGCDVFNMGPYWYINRGDYWYRARSYRGPFVAVDVRYVPRSVFYVPQQRWHHYPRGLAKWHEERADFHGNGNGKGHGHGHGHNEDS